MRIFFELGIFIALLALPVQAHSADIALIIDDIGNHQRETAVFALPTEVALSILPLTALSTRFSRLAAAQKREVMLHIPMESLTGNRLGPGAITADMQPELIVQTLASALASVPDAIGVNNHMGSKLTQLAAPMETTMQFLSQKNLFFVDSRTTRFSQAEPIARETGVLSTKRNVFLDNDVSQTSIDAEFKRLIRLAKKYDSAIAIAHPYPETLAYLERALKDLDSMGVQLVPVSEILHLQKVARARKSQLKSSIALN